MQRTSAFGVLCQIMNYSRKKMRGHEPLAMYWIDNMVSVYWKGHPGLPLKRITWQVNEQELLNTITSIIRKVIHGKIESSPPIVKVAATLILARKGPGHLMEWAELILQEST